MDFKTLIAAAAFVASALAGKSPAAYSTPATYSTPSAYSTPPAYNVPTSVAPAAPTSAAPPPYPYGSFSGSVCVETSTMIWRSSTSVTVYTVTASNGWAYPTGGAAAPTGGVPVPAATTSQWVVPPATGGASSVSNLKAAGVAGAAILVGAAAGLL